MSDETLTYEDIKAYESLFIKTPSFVLSAMVKRKTNLISKFDSQIKSRLFRLNDSQRAKLDIILNSDVNDLQKLLAIAYENSKKKQYKILADPKNKEFIRLNLEELKKIV